MDSRTFYDIDVVNKFTALDYQSTAFEDEQYAFVFVGEDGYHNYYRVEIRFIATNYICCPTYISNGFFFRGATEEEALPIRELMRSDQLNVFCLEQRHHFAAGSGGVRLEVKPFKCFIAASSVEITVYFGGDMEDFLKGYGIE
jgi:hypothetical protein